VSQILTEAWIPVPISKVFAFFSNPQNLPRLLPPQLHAKIEDMYLVSLNHEGVVESGGELTQIAGPGFLIKPLFRQISFGACASVASRSPHSWKRSSPPAKRLSPSYSSEFLADAITCFARSSKYAAYLWSHSIR
jgi:hypothetical protein